MRIRTRLPVLRMFCLKRRTAFESTEKTGGEGHMEQYIPKVIHYSWFGGKEKPAFIRKCISTWEKKLPE